MDMYIKERDIELLKTHFWKGFNLFAVAIFITPFSSLKFFLAIRTVSAFGVSIVFAFGSSVFANTTTDVINNDAIIIFFMVWYFKLVFNKKEINPDTQCIWVDGKSYYETPSDSSWKQ